jgi:hypothetical protein
MDKCVISKKIDDKMDVISTEAMIQEANITTNSARIICQYLWQHFGKSLFASESERRTYFAGSDFPPTVSSIVLPDKTIIPLWYKRPDAYLQNSFKQMINDSLLKDVTGVDVVIGGDHGGGKFHMTMKVNFHLPGKQTVSYLTQIESLSYSKDKTEILRETVLDTIGECLRQISAGGRFKVLGNDLTLEFSLSNANDKSIHCSCPLKLYLVGDLKFYTQMSGREDMSSFWCMWCMLHPSELRSFGDNPDSVPNEEKQNWTVDLHNTPLQYIRDNGVKQAKEIKGVVSEHIWDFIEPKN